jgi:hypothetical protein
MIHDTGASMALLYHNRFLKGFISSAKEQRITITCPISTPRLKLKTERKNLPGGRPISFNALAKTKQKYD